LHDLHEVVSSDVARLVALVVAAQVGGDDAEVGCERRELVAPGVPALRKAVQEDHERASAVHRTVETHAIRLHPAMLERHEARIAEGARDCKTAGVRSTEDRRAEKGGPDDGCPTALRPPDPVR